MQNTDTHDSHNVHARKFVNAANAKAIGTEYMQNVMNTEYMGVILVGSPPREYSVVFDTGKHTCVREHIHATAFSTLVS